MVRKLYLNKDTLEKYIKIFGFQSGVWEAWKLSLPSSSKQETEQIEMTIFFYKLAAGSHRENFLPSN